MTGRATFGEFAATATRHLGEATREIDLPAWPGSADACADVPAAVRSAIRTLTGYAEDVRGVLGHTRPAGRAELRPWIRAASQVRQRLATAEALMQTEPRGEDQLGQDGQADQFASGLRAAVLSMRLGRDLLHTHLDPRLSLAAEGRSEWAPVVTSAPVACALLNRIGGWASQIAPLAGCVAASGGGITAADRRYLYAASQGLWAVSWAVGEAQERQPIPADRLQLLEAIPVNAHPAACYPSGDAPVTGLCDGVISTAERLRAAARQAAARAAWSPTLTRESLRQTAGCCAITASSLRIVLRTLAEHHGSPGAPLSTSMADAAAAADSARATWLQAAEAWDNITTDTRGATSRTAAEAAALALWTGRLAYASPDWTPALGPRYAARPAAELAASPDQLRHVIDAIHHACHTLAQVAEADRSQARSASMTGRLIVPTRSLPDSFDVPYRFAPAPATRSAPLLSSYDLALQASTAATDVIAELAADVKAPSQMLTAYRAATAAGLGASAEGSPSGQLMTAAPDTDGEHRTGAVPGRRPLQPMPPGPVERILLDLDITSPDDLKKAAALDTAADQLILRAAATVPTARPRRDPGRSAGTAELITYLVASNGDRVPAALMPVRPAGRVPGMDCAAPQAHFSAAQMKARQAEPEPDA
jgi:hypothetical protein